MRYGVVIITATGNVISNNIISNIYHEEAILIYRSNGNHIANNSISVVERGITLSNHSTQNTIEGNVVSVASQMAISLHFSSDRNLIRNNQFDHSAIGVILRKSSENRIYNNNFNINDQHGSDDSYNTWHHEDSGNYWSGWINNKPYIISSTATDEFPQTAAFSISVSNTSEPDTASFRDIPLEQIVNGELVFANQTISLDKSLIIKNGGKLLIENAIVESVGKLCEPIKIQVEPGGILEIRNSIITADETGLSPIFIDPAEGAFVTIIDSEFHHVDAGLYSPGPSGPALSLPTGGIFENNLIEDADQGVIILPNAQNISIKNNTFRSILRQAIYGLTEDESIEIKNNKIEDLAIYEIQPNLIISADDGSSGCFLSSIEDMRSNAKYTAGGKNFTKGPRK